MRLLFPFTIAMSLLLSACGASVRSTSPATPDPASLIPALPSSAADTAAPTPIATPVAPAAEVAKPVASATPMPAPVVSAPIRSAAVAPTVPTQPAVVIAPAPKEPMVEPAKPSAPVASPAPPKATPAAVATAPVSKAAAQPAATPSPVAATSSGVGATSSLRGTVQLRARSGQNVSPDEVRDAVLWFKPNRSQPAPKAGRYTIDTRNKRFEPRTLVVPVGSTVDFPNSDPVIHNVFSLAPGNEFDLGLYGEGESAETVLRKPGIVMAFCNVHYSMFAALVVVDTPYTTQVNADGSFELRDLPAGGGVLNLWHPRAEAWVQSLVLPSPQPLRVELPIVKTLIPQHTNKTGGSYRPVR